MPGLAVVDRIPSFTLYGVLQGKRLLTWKLIGSDVTVNFAVSG